MYESNSIIKRHYCHITVRIYKEKLAFICQKYLACGFGIPLIFQTQDFAMPAVRGAFSNQEIRKSPSASAAEAWGPVLISVGNLLTIVLMLLVEVTIMDAPLPNLKAILGCGMIAGGFGVLLWSIRVHSS